MESLIKTQQVLEWLDVKYKKLQFFPHLKTNFNFIDSKLLQYKN